MPIRAAPPESKQFSEINEIRALVRETAHLGPGVQIKGKITGEEDLQLNGTMEGQVLLGRGRFTIGQSGHLTGDVVAREIVVYGSIKGDLRAGERIEIKKDGTVQGDLNTPRIVIDDGAYFKGSVDMDCLLGKQNQSDGGQIRRAGSEGKAKK